MKIVFATHNPNKVQEAKSIFASLPIQLLSLTDLNIKDEVEENGSSFQDNAFIKANYYYKLSALPVFADDSGLIIPALNGDPGILSARYAGIQGDYLANNALVLEKMKNIKDRRAYFYTSIAYIDNNGQCKYFEGRLDGEIAYQPEGNNGFGYDPLFFLPNYQKTLGQLPTATKNTISHRFQALVKLSEYLKKESEINGKNSSK